MCVAKKRKIVKENVNISHLSPEAFLNQGTPPKARKKRRIIRLIAVSMEGGANYEEKPERLILRFYDGEKVGIIPNEKFPLVIIATIANFDVSIILIHEENSRSIM